AGFGIDTTSTGGSGLQLQGTDGLTFTDADSAEISGKSRGIDVQNSGSGALSVTSSGVVTGGDSGIRATNEGSGALSITSSGAVTGYWGYGMAARNHGTDLTLQTAAVTGYWGIRAINSGSSALR